MKYKVITIIFLIVVFIIAYSIVNYNSSPILHELSSDELKSLFKNKKAKYLSKHNII